MSSLITPLIKEEQPAISTLQPYPLENVNHEPNDTTTTTTNTHTQETPEPNPSHVASTTTTQQNEKPEKKTWNEMVFDALRDLSLAYGGEREVFTAEEICERLEQIHGEDAPGISREARRAMVVLVLSMQKALWRKEGGYPPIRPSYLSLDSFDERIKRQQQRTPSPPARAPPVPFNVHISPAFHNHFYHSMPSPPSSPIKWSPFNSPQLNGYHHRNTSRSGTIADVVAAAAVLEAEAASKIRRRLNFKNEESTDMYKDECGERTSDVRFSRYDRHQRQKSCGGSQLLYQQPSPHLSINYSPKNGKKKTKWRELVNMTLRRLYRDNPNRQAFRLKDIADLTEALWDRLRPGKIKPGNFRASVGAVLSAYPEFTTGVGAGHQGWWSLEEMKDKSGEFVPAPATPNTPTSRSRLVPIMDASGTFFENETMPEGVSDEDDFDDDFFMRQGAIAHAPSSYGPPDPMLEDEVAQDGIDGKLKKRKKRKSQRMTWKSLLVWIMRDLANRDASTNGANEKVEPQSQKGSKADVQGIWISMDAIVTEAEKRWAEYGPRASMSKYWRPTLRRTLVENPEFKCGSSGYGMHGMWTLAEMLQESGCAIYALDDITMITPGEEDGSSGNESVGLHSSSEESDVGFNSVTHGKSKNFVPNKFRQIYPAFPCTPIQQSNMSLEHKENDAILGLTSLFQHHTPDVHQYPTAADTNSDSEESIDSSSDESSSESSSDESSDDERPETPSRMDVDYTASRPIPPTAMVLGSRGRGGRERDRGRRSNSLVRGWGNAGHDAPIGSTVGDPELPSPRGQKRKAAGGNGEVKETNPLPARSPPKRIISPKKAPASSKSPKAKQPAAAGAKRKNTTWTDALKYTFEELQRLNPNRTCFHFTEIYQWVDQRWHELFPDRIKNETWQRTISGRLSDIPDFVRTASANPGWWKLKGKPDQLGDLSDYSPPFPDYSGSKPRSRSNSSRSSVTPP